MDRQSGLLRSFQAIEWWSSFSTSSAKYGRNRLKKNLKIEPQGCVLYIFEIHVNHFLEGYATSPIYLPKARDSGKRCQSFLIARTIAGHPVRRDRTRPD